MAWQSIGISIFEFLLTLGLGWSVIFGTYSVFIRLWKDKTFDIEEELKKDNAAVAIVFGTIMICVAMIVQQSVYPVVSILKVFLTDSGPGAEGGFKMLLLATSHLIFGFLLAIGSIWGARRVFDWMNPHANDEKELRKNNPAFAVVMAGVLFVITIFLVDGVSALTKSMIPQPSLGGLRVDDFEGSADLGGPGDLGAPEDPDELGEFGDDLGDEAFPDDELK